MSFLDKLKAAFAGQDASSTGAEKECDCGHDHGGTAGSDADASSAGPAGQKCQNCDKSESCACDHDHQGHDHT